MTTLNAKVILNVKTAAEWANSMEILLEGELGIESDTRLIKVGNGVDTFISLPYTAASDINDIEGVTVTSPTDGNVLTYSNGEWVNITPSSLPADTNLSHYDNTQSGFITASDIPALPADTDLSQYDNSTSGFITASDIPALPADTDLSNYDNSTSGFITASDIPALPADTDLSQYDNSTSGFITASDIPSLPADTDLSQYDNSTSGFITASDIPALPADTDLSNYDNSTSGFITASDIPALPADTDLSNYDNSTSNFATVSQIPTVNNATLTLQQGGTTLATFTANASSDVTVNFAGGGASSTSQLTVDSGLVPDTDASYDLGSNAYRWSSEYVNTLYTTAIQYPGGNGKLLLGDRSSHGMFELDYSTAISGIYFAPVNYYATNSSLGTPSLHWGRAYINTLYSRGIVADNASADIGSSASPFDDIFSNKLTVGSSITLNGTTYTSLLGNPPFNYIPEDTSIVDGAKIKDTNVNVNLIYPQIKQHNGYIYVLGANNSTLNKYNPSNFTQEWSVSTGGSGAAFDVDDSGIWLSCRSSNTLVKKQISLTDGSTLWSESGTLNYDAPQQVVCHDGKAFFFWYYLSGSQVHLCGKSIDEATHAQVDTLPDIDTGTQGTAIVPRPQVKFDSTGNLYVYLVEAYHSGLSTSIYKCAASDYSTRAWSVAIGDIQSINTYRQTAIALAVDDNNVYVGCIPSGSTESVIKILNPATGAVTDTKNLASDPGSRLQALEADNAGHLYTLAANNDGTHTLGNTYYITKRVVSDWSNVWEKSVSRYAASYGVTASFSNIEDYSIWEVDYTGATQISGFRTATIIIPAKVETAANLLPSTHDTYNLGSSSNAWKEAYIDNFKASSGNTDVYFDTNVLPNANSTYSLGSSSSLWNTLYVNTAYTDWIKPTVFSALLSQVSIGESASAGGLPNHPVLLAKSYLTGSNQFDVLVPGKDVNSTILTFIGTDSQPWSEGYFYALQANNLSPLNTGGAIGTSSKYYSDIYVTTVNFSSNNIIAEDPNSTGLYIGWKNSSNVGRYVRFADDEVSPVATGMTLGSSSLRWDNIYASAINCNGTVTGAFRVTTTAPATQTNNTFYNVTNNVVRFTGGIPNNSGGGFTPSEDNKLYLGDSGHRWTAVYAAGGVITTSDVTKKANIVELDSGLKTLNSLSVYSYTWKENATSIVYGFVAQEAMTIAPELVEVPEHYKEGDGTLGIYTNNVLFLAVKAIQELSSKVDELNAKIKVLEGRA